MFDLVQVTASLREKRYKTNASVATHVGQPSSDGSTARENMVVSGSLRRVFKTSLHFFSLIGVGVTTRGFFAFGGTASVSFSFPLLEKRGVSDERREDADPGGLSSFRLCVLDFGVGVGVSAGLVMASTERSTGDGLSFFAGVACARISSSSSEIFVFFRFEIPFSEIFSLSERHRRSSSFSRSMAITSCKMSWEPSSMYGGGGASTTLGFRPLGLGAGLAGPGLL
jgi:hypothetical protein